jgi:hypothetical protein
MANSLDLNKNINDILTKIYANQNLCKLLYYDHDNPLSQTDIADTTVLYTDTLNQRIIPKPFTPDITDERKSTLNIVLNNFKGENKQFYTTVSVDFVIMSHINLWDISDGSGLVSIRPWLIMEEINKTFNRERTVGMGKNLFEHGRIVRPNEYFAGYIYSFESEMFS